MCLSEPQAGSSLSDVTTRAVTDGTDAALGSRYRLFGNKMWISGGDHRLGGQYRPPGAREGARRRRTHRCGHGGISLFVVPKWLPSANGELGDRNDITVMGLNHKMGYRGTTNCLLAFGEGSRHRPDGEAGAIGFRVGEVGQGLAIMFQMMNEGRSAFRGWGGRSGVGLSRLSSFSGLCPRTCAGPPRHRAAETPKYRRCRSSRIPTFGACC